VLAPANGVQRGLVGMALAAVYGLMTGHPRQRSGGLLAPWLVHVLADVTIVAILAVELG
jgi:hypothetical protein